MKAACTICRLHWQISTKKAIPKRGYICPECRTREAKWAGTMPQEIKLINFSGYEVNAQLNGTKKEILAHYWRSNYFELTRAQRIRYIEFSNSPDMAEKVTIPVYELAC